MTQMRCLDCGALGTTTRCESCKADKNAEHLDKFAYYQTPEWRRLRRRCIQRDKCCQVCHSIERLTAHHKHGRRRGGRDSLTNLTTLCARCHSRYEAALRAAKRSQAQARLVRLVDSL